MKFYITVPEGLLRIPLKFYSELRYRFWENESVIKIALYGDWYIFANRKLTRFYVFMKTVSTDRNKDELSFELFTNEFYSPVLRKIEKSSRNT